MKKELNLVITLEKIKLISVNALYNAGLMYRGGKPVPYIYKSPEAKKLEAVIDEQLRAVNWEDHIEWLTNTKQFTVTQQYIFKNGIKIKDVSNFEKHCSDVITRFIRSELGITTFDDSLFSDVHLYKSIIPGSDNEYFCFKISPSNFNMRFDQLEKPEQILFHFEGDSTWETKEFKKEFKALGLKYQLCNTDKKIKDHNTDVYFVNYDEETFMEKLIDLMDILYSKKDSGFCYVGILGNPKDSVVDKINSLGGSTIKAMKLEKHIDIIKLFKDDATC